MSEASGRLRESDLMTVPQALRLLPIGRSTMYALIDSGDLPSCRVGALGSRRGRVLIHRADLEAFVERARGVAPRAAKTPDVDALLRRVRSRGGARAPRGAPRASDDRDVDVSSGPHGPRRNL